MALRISHNVKDFLFAIQEIGKDPLMLSRPSPIWFQSKVDGIILWPGRMDRAKSPAGSREDGSYGEKRCKILFL
jgi:hypothetical protein